MGTSSSKNKPENKIIGGVGPLEKKIKSENKIVDGVGALDNMQLEHILFQMKNCICTIKVDQ